MSFADEAFEQIRRNFRSAHSGMMKKANRESQGEPLILSILMRKGEQTPSRLAEFSGSSSARISAVLGTLEKKGMITRRIDPDDRRNILVSITSQGKERIENNHREMRETLTWIFEQMGEQKTHDFMKLMNEFVTYMALTQPGEPRPTKELVQESLRKAQDSFEKEFSASNDET
ncbi:MAG: MarR family transcriptional regulator [Bifidobacterium sp.]|jgi:DNA-binding MarR family transcriptional regulator|uniref:MarR family transcriptional regulator n=1 Tax=Bifidobacterium fermentum TaxID=3059035 RepID=A0AB39UBC6_9BIFI